ncbi:MAG: patatin-like phospholipase family protein, partial [Bacteroidota bacterium]
MEKIGYVLSGGGVRGFAHLGVLKLLEELEIKPYAIAGTSAGANTGALYASGKTAEEILKLMKSNDYFGWSNLLWRKKGFFSMNVLKKLLKNSIGENNFDAVKVKLFVAATDMAKNESVILSDGKLFEAVVASASVPLVFEPVIMNDKILVDGGILNNFPVEPLVKICDKIIGCNVNKLPDELSDSTGYRKKNVIDRCFHLAISGAVYSKSNLCDVFIEPPLYSF